MRGGGGGMFRVAQVLRCFAGLRRKILRLVTRPCRRRGGARSPASRLSSWDALNYAVYRRLGIASHSTRVRSTRLSALVLAGEIAQRAGKNVMLQLVTGSGGALKQGKNCSCNYVVWGRANMWCCSWLRGPGER